MEAKIAHIMIYPIKSAAGIPLEEAILTKSGLRYNGFRDHEYMLVRSNPDESGIHQFITQRDKRNRPDKSQGLAVMALIKPRFNGGYLELTWNGKSPLMVSGDECQGIELKARIWEDTVYAVDQGKEAAQWASDHLRIGVRLVKAAGRFERCARQNYMANENKVNFHDGYPIHWFSIESVRELSEVAGQQIPWQSFRPQIVVEGMPAQYEHRVHLGSVGSIPFINPKPCDRCPIPKVNQETAEIDPKQPLLALSQYKYWRDSEGKRKVIFGENMLPQGEGLITIGDCLEILAERQPPLRYGKDI